MDSAYLQLGKGGRIPNRLEDTYHHICSWAQAEGIPNRLEETYHHICSWAQGEGIPTKQVGEDILQLGTGGMNTKQVGGYISPYLPLGTGKGTLSSCCSDVIYFRFCLKEKKSRLHENTNCQLTIIPWINHSVEQNYHNHKHKHQIMVSTTRLRWKAALHAKVADYALGEAHGHDEEYEDTILHGDKEVDGGDDDNTNHQGVMIFI
jgi:hypothetical protein